MTNQQRQSDDDLLEQGRRLASEREDLIAAGADPSQLPVPVAPIVVGLACPECQQGKHVNCTEEVPGPSADWVPCACRAAGHRLA